MAVVVITVAALEDLLQSGFVSRCDFLTGQAGDLRIKSRPCSRPEHRHMQGRARLMGGNSRFTRTREGDENCEVWVPLLLDADHAKN